MERRGTGSAPDWRTRLSLELRRDKKKTAALVAVLLVAAVLGGRMIVNGTGPAEASASQKNVATAKVFTRTPGIGGGGSLPFGAAARDKYIVGIKPGITRDLFKLTPELFPLTHVENTSAGPKPATRPAKVDKEAERKRRIEAISGAIRSDARKQLDLQSTIEGVSPMAIINGKLCCIGTRIGEFRLVTVSSRMCEVERVVEYLVDDETGAKAKLAVRATIRMRSPGPRTGPEG